MKFAIIENSSRTVPGDERSRTHPGHGYPEHTETVTTFREFESKQALIDHISRWHSRGINGRVIQFEDMTVTARVEIEVAASNK